MELTARATVTDSMPEFAKILDSFAEELCKAESLRFNLSSLSRNLKAPKGDFSAPNPTPSKEPETITEHLWYRIWRLRDVNNENEAIISHLHEIIGS